MNKNNQIECGYDKFTQLVGKKSLNNVNNSNVSSNNNKNNKKR